jgi:basic membrane lipoprotein Med (substrate-binding protein (PBP1-ABC) superfamily)
MLLAAVAVIAIATTAATAKPAKPAATIKVGLVTDIAGLGDKSFNYLAGQGLKAA